MTLIIFGSLVLFLGSKTIRAPIASQSLSGLPISSQFVKPDSSAEISFDSEMASLLDSIQKPNSVALTPSAIKDSVLKLIKKRYSVGTDIICAEPFITASDLLYNHPALLFKWFLTLVSLRTVYALQ